MTLDNFSKDPESNSKMSGSPEDRLAALTAKDFLLKSGLGMNNAEKGAEKGTDALIATLSKYLSPSGLLGVNGNVIIAHGRSQAKAIKNAIGLAKETVERGITEKITEGQYG